MTQARSTPLYRLIVEALEVRRRELGWTFAVCDAKAGVQNGYTAKMFRPDTPSGRIAQWGTLQLLVDAMYAGTGFRLFLAPDHPARLAQGVPTPMGKLMAALMLGGFEGARAFKLIAEAGIEIDRKGRVIFDKDRSTHKRENRRRKTRETIRTKVRKDASVTAAQY